MGALTTKVFLGETEVLSGDVIQFRPAGLRRLFRRPFLAVVDIRDRSVPYVVLRRRRRVLKVPLDGAAFASRGHDRAVFRLPGIDRKTGSTIAAAAAERMGEGIHHPAYDCGREVASDEELVREAYRAAGIDVSFAAGRPSSPLRAVTSRTPPRPG